MSPTLRRQASGVEKAWVESSWAKGMARKAAKASLTDMGRFKLMIARKTVRALPSPL